MPKDKGGRKCLLSVVPSSRIHLRLTDAWIESPSTDSACCPLKEGEMKQTNLHIFLQLGAALERLRNVKTDMERIEFSLIAVLVIPWLQRFLCEIQDVPLPNSCDAARCLLRTLQTVNEPTDVSRAITQSEVIAIWDAKEQFEQHFEREHRSLDVFTVMPKGIYDTRLLAERTEEKFPETIRKHFSDTFVYDLRQAGRCLAFEVATAAAFHIFRATESMILRYYEVLASKSWPHKGRNWAEYIKELNKLPTVNSDVTMRLDEIRKFERNPSIHPEHIVALEKAPVLFELCSGVIYTIGDEINRLRQPPS